MGEWYSLYPRIYGSIYIKLTTGCKCKVDEREIGFAQLRAGTEI